MKDIAYIAIGSNLGRREVFLADARAAIAGLPQTSVLAETEVEETVPIGPVEQGPFLNQMIAVQTELSPAQLLSALQGDLHGGRSLGPIALATLEHAIPLR